MGGSRMRLKENPERSEANQWKTEYAMEEESEVIAHVKVVQMHIFNAFQGYNEHF